MLSWTHHAYLIQCFPKDYNLVRNCILSSIEVDTAEVQTHNHNSLGIDNVRLLISIYSKSTFQGINKRVAFITAESITNEAQNALLKFFEEVNPGNHFILMIPSKNFLLSTFRSRFEEVDIDGFLSDSDIKKANQKDHTEDHISAKAEEFLKMGLADRLKFVTKITEDLSDEKLHKTDILEFLHELEKQVLGGKIIKKTASNLEPIMTAEKYLLDRSSSAKILLENIALAIETK